MRNHNLVAFRQAWKRFEEAVPGSLRLVPQPALHAAIERDYRAMRDMILGERAGVRMDRGPVAGRGGRSEPDLTPVSAAAKAHAAIATRNAWDSEDCGIVVIDPWTAGPTAP